MERKGHRLEVIEKTHALGTPEYDTAWAEYQLTLAKLDVAESTLGSVEEHVRATAQLAAAFAEWTKLQDPHLK